MPEIHSPSMPEPLKSRYQADDGSIRLPCDDMKVADSISCEKLFIYCADPMDKISFSIIGSGDMFAIETTCLEFTSHHVDWVKL